MERGRERETERERERDREREGKRQREICLFSYCISCIRTYDIYTAAYACTCTYMY